MKLIALQDQNPDGLHPLKTGERFEMDVASARLLIALNLAAEDIDETPKRGFTRRREMRADK